MGRPLDKKEAVLYRQFVQRRTTCSNAIPRNCARNPRPATFRIRTS